jgi:hypothetical protein
MREDMTQNVASPRSTIATFNRRVTVVVFLLKLGPLCGHLSLKDVQPSNCALFLEKRAVFDWEICLIERYLEEPRSKTTHQNLDKRR